MFAIGDRVKHSQAFVDSVKHLCINNEAKLTWLNGEGVILTFLGQDLCKVLWDCDKDESLVSCTNLWFANICGDSFYYDDRPGSLLVGFCKLQKLHEGECVPTKLK